MKISESYQRKLKNYLLWATMEMVGTAGGSPPCSFEKDVEKISPEELMFVWESKGVAAARVFGCTDPRRLYRYAAGKSLRDYYVSNWVSDVKENQTTPEELICVGGMDIEEFIAVFKRQPDAWLLRRIWRREGVQQCEENLSLRHSYHLFLSALRRHLSQTVSKHLHKPSQRLKGFIRRGLSRIDTTIPATSKCVEGCTSDNCVWARRDTSYSSLMWMAGRLLKDKFKK